MATFIEKERLKKSTRGKKRLVDITDEQISEVLRLFAIQSLPSCSSRCNFAHLLHTYCTPIVFMQAWTHLTSNEIAKKLSQEQREGAILLLFVQHKDVFTKINAERTAKMEQVLDEPLAESEEGGVDGAED